MLTDQDKARLALARAAELHTRQRTNMSSVEVKLPAALAKVVKGMPPATLQDLISRFVVAELKAKSSVPSRASKATQDTLDLIAKSAVKPAPVPGPAAGAVGVHEAVGAGARHARNRLLQEIGKRARREHGIDHADDGLSAATAALSKSRNDEAMTAFIRKTSTTNSTGSFNEQNADGRMRADGNAGTSYSSGSPTGAARTTASPARGDASRQQAKPATSSDTSNFQSPTTRIDRLSGFRPGDVEVLESHGIKASIRNGEVHIDRVNEGRAKQILAARGGSKT